MHFSLSMLATRLYPFRLDHPYMFGEEYNLLNILHTLTAFCELKYSHHHSLLGVNSEKDRLQVMTVCYTPSVLSFNIKLI
jgi:hypothetical protein